MDLMQTKSMLEQVNAVASLFVVLGKRQDTRHKGFGHHEIGIGSMHGSQSSPGFSCNFLHVADLRTVITCRSSAEIAAPLWRRPARACLQRQASAQDPPAAYAASRALVNLTAAPGNFHEVLQCLVEGLKVNRDVARMRTAQVLAPSIASVFLMRALAFTLECAPRDRGDARKGPADGGGSICPHAMLHSGCGLGPALSSAGLQTCRLLP
jgi:hypothetical protein